MNAVIHQTIEALLKREGGTVNHQDDAGGHTRWGITEQVARDFGYQGPIDALPKSVAREIYTEIYWYESGCDALSSLSIKVAEEVFDTGVNCGVPTAGQFLQRALNALNHKQELYPDLTADGQVGKRTASALSAFLNHRGREGESVLVTALNCLQGSHYIQLCEKREANESFVYGWLSHRILLT